MPADLRIAPIGNDQRSIRRDADIGRAECFVGRSPENVDDVRRVSTAVWLDDITANHIRAGIAVNDLTAEHLGQQAAFINADAGRRALPGLQEIWNHPGIIQMPMAKGDFLLHIGAFARPGRAGHFVLEPEISVLHHVVDADAFIAVIIVVGLPERAERVDGHLIVIAEIVGQHFEFGTVDVHSENHAVAIRHRIAAGLRARLAGDDGVAKHIHYFRSIRTMQFLARVAHVEVQFAIGPEDEGVNRVVVLHAANLAEQHFLFAGVTGSIIREYKYIRRIGHDHFVAQHADAERAGQIGALVKHGLLISLTGALGVFEDDDPIALFPQPGPLAVVHAFANPDTPHRIDIDVGGLQQHRLGRENRGLQTGGDLQQFNRLIRRKLCERRKASGGKHRGGEEGAEGFSANCLN